MTTNPKITIIIPVYNGGDFLEKTLNNILQSTFKSFEVICVDDLSTDESKNIIEKYSQKDSRIKLYTRETKGGTAVKGIKFGLQFSNGDYYFFMSQDDLIDQDCLEKLYNKAIETGADAVVPNCQFYYEKDKENEKTILPPNQNYDLELSGRDAFKIIMPWDIHGFYLRKMDLVKKYGFDDTYLTGCEYASREHIFYSNKVVFVNTNFYYRQDNSTAITKNFKPIIVEDIIIYIKLLNFIKHKKFEQIFLNKWIKHTLNLIKFYKKTIKENYNKMSKDELKLAFDKLQYATKNFIIFALKNLNIIIAVKAIIIFIQNQQEQSNL